MSLATKSGKFKFFKALLIYGGVVAFICVMGMHKMKKVEQWPKVEGEITRSKDVSDPKSVQVGPQVPTKLALSYTYVVDSKEYKSSRISFLTKTEQNSSLKSQFYPVGKIMDVYYNPQKPSEAFLFGMDEHDTQWMVFILVFHCLITGSGIFGMLYVLMKGRGRD